MESGSLEAALLDQRMRADRHKANFETLKAQHLSHQESHQSLRLEYETLSESYDKLHLKSQEIIQTLQRERDEKILECEELRSQVLTSEKLEQLQMQLREEVEGPYRKQLDASESDLETLRSEYNKLWYNYSFLKSEFEASTATHHSVVEELMAKHEAEVSAYVRERKELLSRQERDIPSELQRVRHLQRENSELQQRVKGLVSEVEELQAQREHAGTHSEQSFQLQARQLAELQALTKTLELERTSLSEQVQSLQVELRRAHEDQHSLTEQLSTAHREANSLKRKHEEASHRHQMELSELKTQHMQQCRELERGRDESVVEQQATQRQVEALQRVLQDHEKLLTDKERDLERRVQQARDQEWERQVALQREKVELEERLAELQRVQVAAASESQQQQERLEDQMRDLHTHKSTLESELEQARTQAREKAEQSQTLQTELQQLSGTSRKYQALLAEHRSLQQSEQELRASLEKLESTVQLLEGHLARTQEDLASQREATDTTLQRERQSWGEERQVLLERVEECQAQQQTLSQQLTEARRTTKKLQRHHRKQLQELRQSVEVLKAREEQLSVEKEAMRKSLQLENQKLKKKFTDLQRRQREFHFLLHNDPSSYGEGEPPSMQRLMEQSKQHREELQEVSQRLDKLATQAHQQDLPPLTRGDHVPSPSESLHSLSDRDT